MHVAALAILDGTALADASGQLRLSTMCTVIEQRLYLAPRLRQILFRPRFGLGPPIWADDAGFDIRQHVRTRAVPALGGETELLDVCSQLNAQPLDRPRPLWECGS
jgi:diacylglycerol O-acyltransferase / wax synthase